MAPALTAWALRALAAIAALAGQSRGATTLAGDLLLFNGRIHTMDAADTVASVVGIKAGKVVYVGDSQDAARSALGGGGDDAAAAVKAVDLAGRLAVPGLVDDHNHIVLMGNRPGYHTPLENAYSVADAQEALRARAAGGVVPEGEFVTTIGGFHSNQFRERRLPTLAELDAAVPDRPVFLSMGFNGPSVTNSLGRAYLSSLPDAALRPNVSGEGAMAAGQETGKALLALRRRQGAGDRRRGVRDAMAYAAGMGVTTHIDQGAFPATGTPADGAAHDDLATLHDAWLAVHGEGGATVRLRINFLHMDADDAGLATLRARLRDTVPFAGDDVVRTGGVGEFIAASSAGGPVFEQAAALVGAAGWRLEVHSLSTADFAAQIQGLERANATVPGGVEGLRWVIAHVPFITRDYLARLKALGGGVNVSGWNYLAGRGPRAGPPFRDIAESGIRAGFGADGMNIAPMNPWVHAYYATTGRNALGELVNEGQQVDRAQVLRWYTRDNQWFLGGPDEALLGAVEVGRLGDLVVLSDDYFSVSDEDLKKIRSVLTVVGGVIVHDAGVLGQ